MNSTPENNTRILLVDDDQHLLQSMGEWLNQNGFQTSLAQDIASAKQQVEELEFDLAIVDLRLGSDDGLDLLRYLRKHHPNTSVILMTGYATVDTGIEAIRAGAFDLITKPLIDEELLMSIRRALSQRQVIEENFRLKNQLDRHFGLNNIVGNDVQMQKTFEIIESIADTRATVLISGESGTGKSLIARAIHQRSDRREAPFVEVACGALPENLLESELFGHVAGSFTGAIGNKEGKFKLADGGTIFLDEIGTASPGLQVKLLRVLQELEFEQVGGTKTFKVNTRVILATNEDLSKAVEEGTFRQDLFYRINVINLQLPSLKQRPGDISILAHHFLEKVSRETGKVFEGFDAAAMQALQQYRWPGNVRELQNIVERCVLLGKGPLVAIADLPANITDEMVPAQHVTIDPARKQTLKEALEGPERQIIFQVLKENNWNRNATADQLGINRTTLYKKMKRLKLEHQH
jgi:DNA-binding NtrC family response regulator